MAVATESRQAASRRASVVTRKTVGRAAVYLLCLLGSAVMLIPLAWLIRSSVMDISQIFVFPPEWKPDPLVLENYPNALSAEPFFLYFRNTMTILVPVVIGTVVTSALAAFGFARLQWKGRDAVFSVLMSTLMLPAVVTLIPTFIVWSKLGLVNTFVPLILPAWFGGGIFNIFLLRQFFRSIPRDLDESAHIDGANPLQVLWYIIVPLSRPALITVAIFSALGVWNDFLGPLIYLNDSNKFTLAIGLNSFVSTYSSQWQLMMAASVVVIVPALILFFVAQRYFVEGITLTGMKG